jgi:hypothetical protein
MRKVTIRRIYKRGMKQKKREKKGEVRRGEKNRCK